MILIWKYYGPTYPNGSNKLITIFILYKTFYSILFANFFPKEKNLYLNTIYICQASHMLVYLDRTVVSARKRYTSK
jgi:hypothetical protein